MPEEKRKILFVDDDSFLRKVYDAELSEQKFDVVLAVDGQDGLDKAHSEDPGLIILDMIMPKKNGFEVLTALQNDPKTAAIPVIILSNLGQAIDRQKGIDLGAADYLVKDSATLGVIINKINHILNSKTYSKEVLAKSHQVAIKEAKTETILKAGEKAIQDFSSKSLQAVAKGIVKKSLKKQEPKERVAVDTENKKRFNFCPSCGKHLKDNYKFCPSCGYKLES